MLALFKFQSQCLSCRLDNLPSQMHDRKMEMFECIIQLGLAQETNNIFFPARYDCSKVWKRQRKSNAWL